MSRAQGNLSGHLGETRRRISAGHESGVPAGEPGAAFGTGEGGYSEHGGDHASAKRPRVLGPYQVHREKTECHQVAGVGPGLDATETVRDVETGRGQSSSYVQRQATAKTLQPTQGTRARLFLVSRNKLT